MLNYKRFTFNYRHSVFYCISKYYLHGTSYLRDPCPDTGNAPLETLQKVLGHKTIISTQVYAELVNPKIKEDTDKISEKIGGMFRLAN